MLFSLQVIMNYTEFPASLSQVQNATLLMCYISSYYRFEKLYDRKTDIVTWWVMKTAIPEFMLLKYCLRNIYIYIHTHTHIHRDVRILVMMFRQPSLRRGPCNLVSIYQNFNYYLTTVHQVNPKCRCISSIIHDIRSQYLRRNAHLILMLFYKVKNAHGKVHPRNKSWRPRKV